MNIGLLNNHVELIVETLKKFNASRAVVFGSRAKGNWRDNSDIDIAVFDVAHLPGLIAQLDELPMPYKFDIVDYKAINNKSLREHIDRAGIEFIF